VITETDKESTLRRTRGRAIVPLKSPTCDHPETVDTPLQLIDPTCDSRWDAWVGRYADAEIFHTSAWARVLKETYRFEPRYVQASDTQGREVLLPLFEVNSWLTGRRGISLPFSDECPALGDPALLGRVFDGLRREGTRRRWRYVELRCGAEHLAGSTPSSTYFTHHLDLTVPKADLFARFDPAVRRAIRKAEKSDLTVEFSHAEGSMRDYFRLHEFTRRRHGLPPQPFAFFDAIRRHVLEAGLGFLVLVRRGGVPIAGAVFFYRGTQALFKFGASDLAYQALRPVNLALWSAIQKVHDHGCTRLHFGRNAVFHESLRRFKLSWGTVEAHLHYTQFDFAAGRFVTEPSLLQGWQNRIFRRLPLSLSRVAGRLLYSHVA